MLLLSTPFTWLIPQGYNLDNRRNNHGVETKTLTEDTVLLPPATIPKIAVGIFCKKGKQQVAYGIA